VLDTVEIWNSREDLEPRFRSWRRRSRRSNRKERKRERGGRSWDRRRVVRGQFGVVERTERVQQPRPLATRKLDARRRVDSSPSVARSNAGVHGERRNASATQASQTATPDSQTMRRVAPRRAEVRESGTRW